MFVVKMPQLVRQHCLDLRLGQLRQQRVKKHNAFVATKAGEIRIAMTRTA